MKNIKIVINSNINNFDTTSKKIKESKTYIENKDSFIFIVGGSPQELRNGNTIYTQLNCFDLTGLVYILTNNGIVDEKELFFYCHDTCDFGDSFYEKMLEAAKDGLPKRLFINAIESMFIGLYDLAILNKFSSYILDYENTSNDFEVLNKIKSSLISKESFILRNYPHICSTRQDYEPTDVYKNGVVRKTEYFPDIDLYKFKANWFLKNKYEMRL